MTKPWEQYGDSPNPEGPWAQFQGIKESQKTREAIRAQIDADPISQGAKAFPKQGNMVLPGIGSVADKYGTGLSQIAPVGAPTTPAAFSTSTPEQIAGAQAAAQIQANEAGAAELERRAINAPLEKTAGGRIGQFGGEAAVLAPSTLLPGAASVRGSVAAGGAFGAAQPVAPGESRIFNAGAGALTGGAGAYGMTKAAQALSGRVANRDAAGVLAKEQNAPRDAIINQARESGMVIPPASVNPSFLNTTLESIGGKVGTERGASLTNQKVINQLVREELGLPENAPITARTLEAIRKREGKSYEDLSALSPDTAKLVQELRDARFEARSQQKYYDRSANPDAQRAAISAREKAERIERALEVRAEEFHQPDLVERLRNSRALIAKTHSVEDALTAGGNVDVKALGRSDYLSGKLKQVAEFGEQFPKAAQLPESFGSTNVSAGKAFASALMGGGGGAALGPAGVVAAAVPFVAPPVARSVMLSNAMQNRLGPEYGASGMLRLSNALANNKQLQKVLPSLAVPYLPQVEQ